jgi:hypothetical protein
MTARTTTFVSKIRYVLADTHRIPAGLSFDRGVHRRLNRELRSYDRQLRR